MNIALITGAGRKSGLGFETAKQLGEKGYTVILGARREDELIMLTDELKRRGFNASFVLINITDEESAKKAAAIVKERYGRLDVLINNAALMRIGDSIENQDIDEVRQLLNTNVVGTWNVTQKFLPLLRESEHGRIVNVSSGTGSYGDPQYGILGGEEGIPSAAVYGISKLALNGLTVKMAKELRKYNILVNAVCPGITATYDTVGAHGRPASESAKGVVWAATLPDDGPTGGFFRDGKVLPW